mmetsp:Transcript_150507/g.260717  ORF Transcript_150507/g.260717 Transcript_150507/m.260717 type:complete len:112 (+) Transcript_150507:840-1175(+)
MFRFRSCWPPPHVKLHVLHSVQEPQTQSVTGQVLWAGHRLVSTIGNQQPLPSIRLVWFTARVRACCPSPQVVEQAAHELHCSTVQSFQEQGAWPHDRISFKLTEAGQAKPP